MTSFQISLTPSRRVATRFIGAVRRALQKALIEEAKKNGLTQAEVARRIGVNRSIINRELRGVENLSLGRVAELAWALGRVPSFALLEKAAVPGSNHVTDTTPHIINSNTAKVEAKRPADSKVIVLEGVSA